MSPSLSVLDLAPIASGSTARQALRNSVELARLAERLGFRRHWFAEHHGMPSIASSAPEVLIAHAAAATERIRVGSGGIMLPNHVPLQVAERFHTLETLHPGRIDLGVGRAPGTDPATSRALRPFDAEQFPAQLDELFRLSRGEVPEEHPFHGVRVVPEEVHLPPVWILGSSGASAKLAGQLGTGYGFAHHFSPAPPEPAVRAYRESFEPSEEFPEAHVILAVAVVCAETDEEADRLATSMDLVWVHLRRGEFIRIPSPNEASAYSYTPPERAVAESYRRRQIVGSPSTVRARIADLVGRTRADEVMVTTTTYSHEARLRSYELLIDAFGIEAGGAEDSTTD